MQWWVSESFRESWPSLFHRQDEPSFQRWKINVLAATGRSRTFLLGHWESQINLFSLNPLRKNSFDKETIPQKKRKNRPWQLGVPFCCSPTAIWHWKLASDVQEFHLEWDVIMRWLEWLTAIKTSRAIQVQFIIFILKKISYNMLTCQCWNRLTHWLLFFTFFATNDTCEISLSVAPRCVAQDHAEQHALSGRPAGGLKWSNSTLWACDELLPCQTIAVNSEHLFHTEGNFQWEIQTIQSKCWLCPL